MSFYCDIRPAFLLEVLCT